MKQFTQLLSIVALFALFFACGGMGSKDSTKTQTQIFEDDKSLPGSLSLEQAETRKARVSNLRYDLFFNLSEGTEYSGEATLKFKLADASKDLRVDFHEGQIKEVLVQGKKVEAPYNNRYLMLPAKALAKGDNTVVIQFARDYARDGSGLMRFRDQEDGRVYTYTDLEPYDANRVFPTFDQPDLKATYTMRVLAPKEWQVVTSVRESKIENAKEGKREWSFPESQKFSTYIWSLHAGPYKVWEDKKAKVPSRLFVRQSLAKYVNPQEWFTITNQGFEYFNAYFDYPYPFKKYDQLIVPEFNAGAMENVGAVTFSERYVSRGEKSRSEHRAQASVILHEMAHMWYGNLVTMKWWNDLWLNESFATYMASLAMAEATEYKEAWDAFHGTKTWAYWEDQNVTTHPIETFVPSTLEAFANFDGITYGKGASALKQIAFFIGQDKFKKGVQLYFKRHAWENTELTDFISALEEGSGEELKTWQKAWLQTAGVNTVEAKFQCQQNKIESLSLTQGVASGEKLLRPHQMKVALFKDNKAYESFSVRLDGKTTTVTEAKGKACPEFVLPNFEDHAYVRVSLDPKSLKSLEGEITKINDTLTKRLIWSSLWEDFRDAKIELNRFAQMAIAALDEETNPLVLSQLLDTLHGRYTGSASVLYYWPNSTAQEKKSYNDFLTQLESKIWQRLNAAKPSTEQQKIFAESFVVTAESAKAQAQLVDLLSGKAKIKGLDIDQDRRWEIIVKLSQLGHPNASQLIAAEEKRDPSALGKLEAISARAALPEWSHKEKWLESFRADEKSHSYMEQKKAIWSLFPRYQPELQKKYGDQFFKDLKRYNESRDPSFVSSFTGLAPIECEAPDKNSSGIKSFIEDNKDDLVASALKSLKIAAQENERCREIRKLARNSSEQ